jgi:hypothetical protein
LFHEKREVHDILKWVLRKHGGGNGRERKGEERDAFFELWKKSE